METIFNAGFRLDTSTYRNTDFSGMQFHSILLTTMEAEQRAAFLEAKGRRVPLSNQFRIDLEKFWIQH